MDLETYKRLRRQGLNPQQAFSGESPMTDTSDQFSLGQTIKNIPGSAGRFIGGIAGAIANPIQTLKTIGGIGAGAVEKLIPGQQAEEKYIDSIVDVYKKRYGGVDNALKTLEDDPIGVLADLSTVLSGGGAIVSKVGTVSKINKIAKAGELTTMAGNVINPLSTVSKIGQPLKNLFPKVAEALEKSNWRLTKTKEGALLSKASDEAIDTASLITKNKLNEVANFMAEQKIVGSPLGRYAKATELYNKAEDLLDKFFGSISTKAPQIDGNAYIKALNGLKGSFRGHRDYNAITKQIDGAIETVKGIMDKDGRINYRTFNKFKRTTFENAFNQAGDKISDAIEYAIGNSARGMLDESFRGLKVAGQPFEKFNHNYGLLIEGRKILKSAIGKTQLSALSERLLGGSIGYLFGSAAGGVGGGFGAMVGAGSLPTLIEKLPITAIKSGIGAGLETIGKTNLPPVVGKIKAPLTAIERLTERR